MVPICQNEFDTLALTCSFLCQASRSTPSTCKPWSTPTQPTNTNKKVAMSPQSLPVASLPALTEIITLDRLVCLHCHHSLLFHSPFNLSMPRGCHPNIPKALLSLPNNHLPNVMYLFDSSTNRLPCCIWHSWLFLPCRSIIFSDFPWCHVLRCLWHSVLCLLSDSWS